MLRSSVQCDFILSCHRTEGSRQIALRLCELSLLGTLRYGDYGLRTTDYGLRTGGTLGLGRDICVLLSPPSQAHDGS